MEFFCQILNGKLQTNRNVDKEFQALKDGRYKVRIDPANRRSLPQNAYLHGVLVPLVFEGLRDAGFEDVRDHEDAKEVMKNIFLKRKIRNEKTDEVIEIVKRTRDLTTVEMNQFIEDVIQWASIYLQIQIPYPNEQGTFHFAS